MMDVPKPEAPQTFNPADSMGWLRAEWVMQPLSGLEMVSAGWPRMEALPLNPGASTLGWIMKSHSGQPVEREDGDGLGGVWAKSPARLEVGRGVQTASGLWQQLKC